MKRPAPASLWTAATSAASDRYTMDDRGVPSLVLMERAALCVSHEVAARFRAGDGRAVGVLVGPGNNGGDGLAVARQLRGWGIPVEAWMVTERHNEAVAEQRALLGAYGVAVHRGVPGDDEAGRLWVDGLLGTGSRGAPRGAVDQAVRWLGRHRPPCVAIDLPTGVDPDTGAVEGSAVFAECTVTFARSKPGLHVTPGSFHAGEVVVADIGLLPPPQADEDVGLLDPRDVAAALGGLPAGAHKGQRGHLGILGGSRGTAGAALLAGVAALRAGAGLVTVASPEPELATVLLTTRPELMTALVPEDPGALLPRATALVVGPGLTDERSHALLPRLFTDDPRPALWDASALDHVPLHETPAGPRVLTPHPGEAARLMSRLVSDPPWTSARVQSGRLEVARTLAAATRSVVVLKGVGTIVATPPGAIWVAVSGGPALATAGSGDVLSGLGGALLARGMDAESAATVAAHVHGVAGETLAPGAVALDVAEALPAAVRRVLDEPAHPCWPAWREG